MEARLGVLSAACLAVRPKITPFCLGHHTTNNILRELKVRASTLRVAPNEVTEKLATHPLLQAWKNPLPSHKAARCQGTIQKGRMPLVEEHQLPARHKMVPRKHALVRRPRMESLSRRSRIAKEIEMRPLSSLQVFGDCLSRPKPSDAPNSVAFLNARRAGALNRPYQSYERWSSIILPSFGSVPGAQISIRPRSLRISLTVLS